MSAGPGPRHGRSFADEAFAAAADAYASAPERWELAIHSAIEGLFAFLAGSPERTSECIVENCGSGPRALDERDRMLARFLELLDPGPAVSSGPPPVVTGAIGGGVYELVRGHVLERRLNELPAAAPDATIFALSPFIGIDEAIELVTSRSTVQS